MAVITRSPKITTWHGIVVVVALVALAPALQYAAGMYAFAGPAWMATIYLVGFLLAMLVGVRWESANAGQPSDALFLAIGLAATVSVGLQLHQWVSLDRLFVWDMGNQTGRPFANFGQPNLLATFLLWAVLGVAWGVQRKSLGLCGGLVLALFFLFGVALTGSRAAWVAVGLLVAAAWFWRRLWASKWVPWAATGLGLYFWGCIFIRGEVRDRLLLGAVEDLTRMAGESRLQVWSFFWDAAMARPFFGYGWNQIGIAQTAIAAEQPSLHGFFSHSHNLFLDLILWCGIPIGLLLGLTLLWWLWSRFRAVKRPEEALLVMVVLVIANHSLVEFPLYHAYLLLPLGLVVGVLDARLATPLFEFRNRWPVLFLWGLSALLLLVTVRDYFRVESSYLAFRFEQANIKTSAPRDPPDVLLLTDLRELIRYVRYEPHRNMSVEEIAWMLSVAELYPSAGVIHRLAAALAWNQRPEEAALWLQRMCKMIPPEECEAVGRAWAAQALNDPQVRAIQWP